MSIFQKINNALPQKHGNVAIGGPRVPLYGSGDSFRAETTDKTWYTENTKETIREYNVAVVSAGTEASLVLPDGTRRLEFQMRGANDLRWGFIEGNPAGSTDPYWTLKSSDAYFQEYPEGLYQTTIYFSADADDVVEVRCQS